jgi:hypothetical protein
MRGIMKNLPKRNRMLASRKWQNKLSRMDLISLDSLSHQFGFSIALGDLLFLAGRWYVTNSGLLRLANRSHCAGIHSQPIREFCDPAIGRWVFKAIAYKSPRSRGFVGYADAEPSNVSPLVRGAEMRVAETRAVNRALRKAFGIGLTSIEELGYSPSHSEPATKKGIASSPSDANGSSHCQPRLRERLCLLIRQHQLDPTLVKLYAADFCGTQEIREASRDLVESFITHLAEWAAQDRAGLLCKLNSFAPSEEVHS